MVAADVKLGAVVGAILSAAIVMTNVILPAIIGHSTPDNNLSESFAWLFVILVVGWMGFKRVRRTSNVGEAALAGGVVSFVAFGIAMATFLVIDNLFFRIVSQQPEKIWLFQHSGYRDMRAYLNHTNLRAFWSVLPMIVIIGTASGAIGGLLDVAVGRAVADTV